jgi:transcriptional regulator with XRE-family HTH domain
MLKTPAELLTELAVRLKVRRLALGWTQQDTAQRAGIAYRTWRRLESEGAASIEDLVKAAVALRCEEGLEALFPPPAAASFDELLRTQAKASTRPQRRRAPNRVRP